MSEAIIARIYQDITVVEGISTLSTNSRSIQLLESQTYTAPTNAVNNTIKVTLVVGKGSDNSTSSGESGEVVTQSLSITPGESINVYIGDEGVDGGNGGTSSFGTYMIANGGLSADNKIDESVEYNSDSSATNGYAIVNYIVASEDNSEEVVGNE